MNLRITIHSSRKVVRMTPHPHFLHQVVIPHQAAVPHLPALALVAALAAFVCGSSPASRIRPFFVGSSLPASRCHCRMAAANTGLPAAKSAK
ncbi:MAG: hypothetical protein J0L63_07750 [Anaerolineae bacterium]|nr:hypothetical protein [Anaerolineae bacterium]MBN8618784.1 hypothetical protein [Anaerolineae bacterium]